MQTGAACSKEIQACFKCISSRSGEWRALYLQLNRAYLIVALLGLFFMGGGGDRARGYPAYPSLPFLMYTLACAYLNNYNDNNKNFIRTHSTYHDNSVSKCINSRSSELWTNMYNILIRTTNHEDARNWNIDLVKIWGGRLWLASPTPNSGGGGHVPPSPPPPPVFYAPALQHVH